MYCIKCGVKLADTEKKCPLCNTIVSHPEFTQTAERPLYPSNKIPKSNSGSKALNGAIIILFLIPLLVCFFADGWSIYPLVVLSLFGSLLIYLAINSVAREILERKLFF